MFYTVALTTIAVFTTMNQDVNHSAATFDAIKIHRPELAQRYLDLLAAQPGRPLALFAPHHVGKTFFLEHDLAPAARQSGILPIYADLWLHRADPLGAINHTLEETLNKLTASASSLGKLNGERDESGESGESARGEGARRPLPLTPELRLDALVSRLIAAHGGKILLMLDEAQTLADACAERLATFRAVLHGQRARFAAVLVGASQEGLLRLMMSAGAPMYQFAQLLTFPVLDDEYLTQLAAHFSQAHPGKQIDLDELHALFAKIGFKPALLRDIVKTMSTEGVTDIKTGLRRHATDARQAAGWHGLLQPLSEFERQVLAALGQGRAPFGKQTLLWLAEQTNSKVTIAKVRVSVGRLMRMGLLTKTGGTLAFEDPLFAEFMASGSQ
jgi:hypothetical protein